jgi:hypothetical protein
LNCASKLFFVAVAAVCPIAAQPDMHDMHNMHNMAGSGMSMTDMNPAGMFLMREASGTAVNPASWQMPMWMMHFGGWNTMLMGTAFVVDTQQSGPRGGDKFYSPNWGMANVGHRVGAKGWFQADLMLSLDPATMTDRRYPMLFQTGETAFGKPLIDAQHPHNFIMGLGLHYAYQVAENTTLEGYFAPVGDPALGPVAYPHRASAMEFPEATLSHHLQDSTHISDEVATVGLTYKKVKLEASGFHGGEPGENRWIVEAGGMDSYSARIWVFPNKNWAAQLSGGRLTRPEALEPGDQVRTSASIAYTRPIGSEGWSTSFIWGRVHKTDTGHDLNSYLVESVLPVKRRNFLTGRFERVDKDELAVEGFFTVTAYTFGYTRDVGHWQKLEAGIGANFTAYAIPSELKPAYGDHPVGGNIFLRFRLRQRTD